MTYQQFKEMLAHGHHFDKDDYHKYIIQFASDIIQDVGRTNQKQVAKELGLNHVRFNNMMGLIRALSTSDQTK